MFHNTEAISHKNTENFVRILGFKTGSKEGYPYKGGWVLVSIPSYARSISVRSPSGVLYIMPLLAESQSLRMPGQFPSSLKALMVV